MRKKMSCLLICLMIVCLPACSKEPKEESVFVDITEVNEEKVPENKEEKILTVYFSCVGEQYQVGVIEEGNTAIVAKMISEKTGADLFEIKPIDDRYELSYSDLTDYAKKEQNEDARPEYRKEDEPDLSAYDVIFVGAPVWWGDWPMIMYSFFENNSAVLRNKTLVPFSSHGGSGLAGFDKKLGNVLKDAKILEGLAINGVDAQNDREGTNKKVSQWLNKLGY